MKLVIIRRPETNKNANLPGEPEMPSPQGQEQIREIAEKCRHEGIQAVVYSTEPRAAFAADALAQNLQIPHVTQEGLQERSFGDWDEWEWPQIAAELDKLTPEERYTFVPPNGESWQQMEERLRATLKHIGELGYDTVAVMTHWGSIRAMLPILRKEPKESTLQLQVANGQMFVENYDATTV